MTNIVYRGIGAAVAGELQDSVFIGYHSPVEEGRQIISCDSFTFAVPRGGSLELYVVHIPGWWEDSK